MPKKVTRSGWFYDEQGNELNIPEMLEQIVVLLGGNSSSASEVFAYASEEITGVGGLTLPTGTSTGAIITVEGDAARYRVDGGAATAEDGHQLLAGDVIELTSTSDVAGFSLASTGTTLLKVSFVGYL